MSIETKFYHQSSINANFDMQKIKLALSDFPEIDDVAGVALGFDVLHVKKVFNNKLFLEFTLTSSKHDIKATIGI